ncbi:SHOCT domain-containing protein [Actinoplanes sp. NEAU-A12]|uniref:SHOCT domain-containing protein n=1 Tax=Actinoplanes sandaracinus TaxID=3045177 RepID=A0ABT6WBN6_9ACTN|nr:SHOCT domain-containing protein [Actinoplanes sandaracinus]MDI6097135.1 SHOCT domain-containing protein [Actinoplanes sandaracinus]
MSFDGDTTVPDHCTESLARARRHSIDTAGALAVAAVGSGSAPLYLLVYPDRLELASAGGMLGTGAGRERIEYTAIDDVTARDRLIRSSLEISTGGRTVSFSTGTLGRGREAATYLAALIRQRLGATPDNTALLHQLAALHTAGLLTDEEYAAKRATLLS